MKLSQIVKQCCIRVGDPVPTNVFSDEDSSREWLGYVSQASQQIIREHSWQRLCKIGQITATEGTIEYDFPDDFEQIISYWIYNKTKDEYINIADDDTFNQLDEADDPAFLIIGGKFRFSKPIDAGSVLVYQYKINSVCKFLDENDNFIYKPNFTDEYDEFLLDPELLILKSIALRSQNLGFADYATRSADYERYLEMKVVSDGANIHKTVGGGFTIKTTPNEWSVVK